jgi:hypothetical protein
MNNWNTAATRLRQSLYDIGDGLAQSHKAYNEQELTNKLGIDRAAANLPY